ncbi:MAG: hypothetical protein DMG92_06230 [Acidobacteria bacterium]|nr:MAG: hypothetical protein DMG92_06230 [Acidobacteriota bacterium]
MKKVAATRGQSVRRADFFFLGESRVGERWGRGALAVANCYGFLLERLTLSCCQWAGPLAKIPVLPIPGIALKLVRRIEFTENFDRCKKNFVNFVPAENGRAALKIREQQIPHRSISSEMTVSMSGLKKCHSENL